MLDSEMKRTLDVGVWFLEIRNLLWTYLEWKQKLSDCCDISTVMFVAKKGKEYSGSAKNTCISFQQHDTQGTHLK